MIAFVNYNNSEFGKHLALGEVDSLLDFHLDDVQLLWVVGAGAKRLKCAEVVLNHHLVAHWNSQVDHALAVYRVVGVQFA